MERAVWGGGGKEKSPTVISGGAGVSFLPSPLGADVFLGGGAGLGDDHDSSLQGEESLTHCSVVGTSPLQTSVGSCPVLAVTLRAISFPWEGGTPWPRHLLALLWPLEPGASPLLAPTRAVCLLM